MFRRAAWLLCALPILLGPGCSEGDTPAPGANFNGCWHRADQMAIDLRCMDVPGRTLVSVYQYTGTDMLSRSVRYWDDMAFSFPDEYTLEIIQPDYPGFGRMAIEGERLSFAHHHPERVIEDLNFTRSSPAEAGLTGPDSVHDLPPSWFTAAGFHDIPAKWIDPDSGDALFRISWPDRTLQFHSPSALALYDRDTPARFRLRAVVEEPSGELPVLMLLLEGQDHFLYVAAGGATLHKAGDVHDLGRVEPGD